MRAADPTPSLPAAGRTTTCGLPVVAALLFLAAAPAAWAKTVIVHDAAALQRAAQAARPGTRIELAPGTYAGGIRLAGLAGTAAHPIVLAAQDRTRRPEFRGGTSGLQLSDPVHVVLEDLVVVGARGNGLNIDDGGTPEGAAHHVTLRRIEVRDVGPSGNCDGIKLSGVDDLQVEDCVVERWGDGGSAVDMVGCHRAVVRGCTFRHTRRMTRGSGVQAKGGSAEITIRGNRFEHAGARAVNAGGSTGLAYFRPPVRSTEGPLHEARAIRVVGNTFVGSAAAVAFVGVDGAEVRQNTIYRPGRWAFRILQETRAERFVPSRRGVVSANLIVFRSDAWSEGGVNVGAGTAPKTFTFERNAWFCEDQPRRTRALVRTPVEDTRAIYGVDPPFEDEAHGDLRIGKRSQLHGTGTGARATK